MAGIRRIDSPQLVVATDDIARRPRRPLQPGVDYAVLWREGASLAGLMWVSPGSSMPKHTHERSSHHVWLVSGRAGVAGQTLQAGTYWHVPAGTPHAVEGLEPVGCTLFYLYLTAKPHENRHDGCRSPHQRRDLRPCRGAEMTANAVRRHGWPITSDKGVAMEQRHIPDDVAERQALHARVLELEVEMAIRSR